MSKPHFIIGGERRSGSTTLYDMLRQHPDIGMLEVSDFDYFIEPGLFSIEPVPENKPLEDWEATHSIQGYTDKFKEVSGVTGQKDADLLWWRPAHERLARFLPETKFLFVLREPVRRAESQYFNELSKKRELRSFKEALREEDEQAGTPWQKLHLRYKKRGCYVESLEHFYNHISRDRTKVIILEELVRQPQEVLGEICEFLGVDAEKTSQITTQHSNKEAVLRRTAFSRKAGVRWAFDFWDRLTEALIVRIFSSKTQRQKWRKRTRFFYYTSARKQLNIDETVRQELHRYYEPYNLRLERLLNKDLKHWKLNA